MKSAYALFSYYTSPIAITYPTLVAVFEKRADAIAECDRKSQRATRNSYYVKRVPFTGSKA